MKKCDACKGTGTYEKKCPTCTGTGTVPCEVNCTTNENVPRDRNGHCLNCHGSGAVPCYLCCATGGISEPCSNCNGRGYY